MADLDDFAGLIRIDWERRVFEESILKEDNESTIAYIERQFREIGSKFGSIMDTMQNISTQNKEILAYFRTHVLTPTPTPTKSKRKIAVTEDNNEEEEESSIHANPNQSERPTRNLNDALKAYVPITIEMSGFTIGDLVKKSIEFKWHKNSGNIPLSNKGADKSNKGKIIKVLNFFLLDVMTEEEKGLANAKPPAVNSADHI